MDSPNNGVEPSAQGSGLFTTTHWSVVLAAGNSGSSDAAQALEKLCGTYWYPLYVYVRRRGHSPEDAQDVTQEFLTRLLSTHALSTVHPAKGRFRSFLLASLNHFLANERDKARAQKRGELPVVHVSRGKQKGLRIRVLDNQPQLFE